MKALHGFHRKCTSCLLCAMAGVGAGRQMAVQPVNLVLVTLALASAGCVTRNPGGPNKQTEVNARSVVQADVSQQVETKVSPLTVETLGDGRTKLTATRTHGAAEHTASVIVQGTGTTHGRAAGAKAWSGLGKASLDNGALDAAIACAKAGIEELGDDYKPPRVRDSTGMKLHAAAERIEAGAKSNGAEVMLDMLNSRIEMYLTKHSEVSGE